MAERICASSILLALVAATSLVGRSPIEAGDSNHAGQALTKDAGSSQGRLSVEVRSAIDAISTARSKTKESGNPIREKLAMDEANSLLGTRLAAGANDWIAVVSSIDVAGLELLAPGAWSSRLSFHVGLEWGALRPIDFADLAIGTVVVFDASSVTGEISSARVEDGESGNVLLHGVATAVRWPFTQPELGSDTYDALVAKVLDMWLTTGAVPSVDLLASAVTLLELAGVDPDRVARASRSETLPGGTEISHPEELVRARKMVKASLSLYRLILGTALGNPPSHPEELGNLLLYLEQELASTRSVAGRGVPIEVVSPLPDEVLHDRTAQIRGSVGPRQGPTRVTVNGRLATTSKDGAFLASLQLPSTSSAYEWALVILAYDGDDLVGKLVRVVRLDHSGLWIDLEPSWAAHTTPNRARELRPSEWSRTCLSGRVGGASGGLIRVFAGETVIASETVLASGEVGADGRFEICLAPPWVGTPDTGRVVGLSETRGIEISYRVGDRESLRTRVWYRRSY